MTAFSKGNWPLSSPQTVTLPHNTAKNKRPIISFMTFLLSSGYVCCVNTRHNRRFYGDSSVYVPKRKAYRSRKTNSVVGKTHQFPKWKLQGPAEDLTLAVCSFSNITQIMEAWQQNRLFYIIKWRVLGLRADLCLQIGKLRLGAETTYLAYRATRRTEPTSKSSPNLERPAGQLREGREGTHVTWNKGICLRKPIL